MRRIAVVTIHHSSPGKQQAKSAAIVCAAGGSQQGGEEAIGGLGPFLLTRQKLWNQTGKAAVGTRRLRDQLVAERARDRLGSRMYVQLLINGAQVKTYGVNADPHVGRRC